MAAAKLAAKAAFFWSRALGLDSFRAGRGRYQGCAVK